MSLNLVHGEVYLIQLYVMKYVSDLRQIGGFLWVLRFPPGTLVSLTNKVNHHDIAEILLEGAFNIITLTPPFSVLMADAQF